MSDDDPHFTDPPEPQPEGRPAPTPQGAAELGAAVRPENRRVYVDDEGKIHVPLTKDVPLNSKQMISEIVLRRPTGADILEIGCPVIFDPGRAQITHDMNKMPAMIFKLSGVHSAALAKMETDDLMTCFWEISHFFLPRM